MAKDVLTSRFSRDGMCSVKERKKEKKDEVFVCDKCVFVYQIYSLKTNVQLPFIQLYFHCDLQWLVAIYQVP